MTSAHEPNSEVGSRDVVSEVASRQRDLGQLPERAVAFGHLPAGRETDRDAPSVRALIILGQGRCWREKCDQANEQGNGFPHRRFPLRCAPRHGCAWSKRESSRIDELANTRRRRVLASSSVEEPEVWILLG